MHLLDPKDGGFLSRKLLFGLAICVSTTLTAILGAWKLPAILPVMDTLVGGLVGVFAIYCGANVGNKWTIGKVAQAPSAPAEESKE